MLSILDIFRIGIGPSSSHTVGPLRIAKRFVEELKSRNLLDVSEHIVVKLRGSLAFTGKGHATPHATILGLMGFELDTMNLTEVDSRLGVLNKTGRLKLGNEKTIRFCRETDIIYDYDVPAKLHPNEMAIFAYDKNEIELYSCTFYSTGGGFVSTHSELSNPIKLDSISERGIAPYPYTSAAELLGFCASETMNISDIVLQNETAMRSEAELFASIDKIVTVMMTCIDRGLHSEGVLPGGLEVKRRASDLWQKLQGKDLSNEAEDLFDRLNVYAMAVNEENASGGQVVTAPTNGAAGIIPAILRHYCQDSKSSMRTFILTAGAIGILYKQQASISGAEMGCQGEVGVACSMAAGGLAAVWGGTAEQIANAAEIGMEHNLGLTCDPVGGLVQIPCIERNAVASVKAVNAARLALHSHDATKVSLDQVIETMRQTGLDMSSKYKETSQGGLAVNVIEC